MPAYRDEKRGTWYVQFRYKTWNGEMKRITKRGFDTKREAVQYERDFLLNQSGSLEMTFSQFVEGYKEDISPRIKESTFETKKNIIDNRILPYFSEMRMCDITSADVLQWQNQMMKTIAKNSDKNYSKSYLKTIHNQLSAIFNHAVKFYRLPENPARVVGNMGSEKDIKMKFWTLEEYKSFSESMMDKPVSFYIFEVLYWCGLRLGEMLALTPSDVNLVNKTISIDKTYYRSGGDGKVTSPKTQKSVRVITIPDFLAEELEEYMQQCYGIKDDDRLFPVTKNYVEREMKRGIKEQELASIRVHDLRHSHVSLLIDMGYSAVSIADRMGHESIDITYRYAHMFPTVQKDMADRLNNLKEGF